MTFTLNTRPDCGWSGIVLRLGLPVRLAGTEGSEELELLAWPVEYLKRWGSDNLLVKVGRGMFACFCWLATSHAPPAAWLRVQRIQFAGPPVAKKCLMSRRGVGRTLLNACSVDAGANTVSVKRRRDDEDALRCVVC
jgi:hypothetical protein